MTLSLKKVRYGGNHMALKFIEPNRHSTRGKWATLNNKGTVSFSAALMRECGFKADQDIALATDKEARRFYVFTEGIEDLPKFKLRQGKNVLTLNCKALAAEFELKSSVRCSAEEYRDGALRGLCFKLPA